MSTFTSTRFFGAILICLGFIGTSAQSETSTTKSKSPLILGITAGIGSLGVNHFNDDRIKDHGSTQITSSLQGEIQIGYRLSDKVSLLTGLSTKSFSAAFEYKNEEYSYRGGRYSIPLTLRYTFSNKMLSPFCDMGLYYAFGNRNFAVNETTADRLGGQPFDNLGYKGAVGIMYNDDGGRWSYLINLGVMGDASQEGKISLAGYSINMGFQFYLL